jgi:diacylglycerol kinase (ATP)
MMVSASFNIHKAAGILCMLMANQNQTGLKRIHNAALYSIAGIRACYSNEAAFRQESTLCLIAIPLAFWIGDTAVERAVLMATCLLVLVTELLNSAVEAAIDRIGEEPHKLSKGAKDMGSAAVFFSLWIAGITWTLIAYERFFG